MEHQLENEYLIASFKEAGAEITSLRHKKTRLEYIWNANPDVWARHAPILFPIVGRLKDNHYSFNGQEYSLSQHGFARDMVWELEDKQDDRLTFCLKETRETLEKYPFSFELRTIYKLEGETLTITHLVKNTGQQQMPFSIGAHPGFTCPLQDREVFEDYFLEFEKAETLEREHLTNGLRNGKKEAVLKNEKIIPLSQQLFALDALVLEGVQSDWVAVKSSKGTNGLLVGIKDFPYLGIWTKGGKGSNFICIEPWYGVADKVGGVNEILRKEGIQILAPGQEFSCTYSVQVF